MSKHKKNRQFFPPSTTPAHRQPGQVVATQVRFQGPLPPPEVLERFEAVLPGLADRMTTMAEGYANDSWKNNQAVRIVSLVGPLLAFIIAMTVILGGFYMIYKGKSIEGITALVTALAALAGTFIYGKRQQQQPPTQEQTES